MLHSKFKQTFQVNPTQTAEHLGSGTLAVLATPALISFMENTALKLLADLPPEETSVGISMNMKHLKASGVGEIIQCEAILTVVEGRKYTFEVSATNAIGDVIAQGVHERVVVNIEKFMSKVM